MVVGSSSNTEDAMTDKTPTHTKHQPRDGQTDGRPHRTDLTETRDDKPSDAGPKRSQKQPGQDLQKDTDDAE